VSGAGDLLPGLGPKSGVPSVVPGFDWRSAALDPKEGFVLSRVDGRTSLGEILLLVPFPEAETAALLRALHGKGALLIPGVPRPARKSDRDLKPPVAPVADGIDLSPELRRRVDELLALVPEDRPFALLGVEPGVDEKELRRAYFKLSKELHPDRHFGKQLGPYRRRLQEAFAAISAAFELLSDGARRAEEERRARAKR
jgi:hypothetical protein